MNWIDIVLAIPLLWAAYKGWKKGLVFEIIGLLALAIGLWAGINLSDFTADWLSENVKIKQEYLPVVSFAVTFVGVVILVHFVGKMVNKLVKAVALGTLNRAAGVVFGVIKVGLIISTLLMLTTPVDQNFKLIDEKTKEESILFEPMYQFSGVVLPAIKNSDFYNKLHEQDWMPQFIKEKMQVEDPEETV